MKRVVASLFIGLFLVGSAAAQNAGLRSFRQIGGATHELNTDQLVASHPSLSMGTQLKVTNTANGQEVIVTVTGRIPASGTRIVDLSRAAASRLEMNATGTTPVTIEVLRNTEQAAAPEPPAPEPVEEPPVVLAMEEPEPEPVEEPPVVAAAEPPPKQEPAPAPTPAPAPAPASTTPLTIYNTITVEASAPATPTPAPTPAPAQVTPVVAMPQLVKVIPAPVYYSPVTTIPVVAAPAYCPPVTVPVVTAPVYCPPAASVPLIVAPARQIQTQCPPGLSTYPAQVYTVPAPQAYRQVQSQPSYVYTQPQQQQQYIQPQQQYVQPQQQYSQPQQQYAQPQQQYSQPQQQYVQPQQAAPQVQVYTSPPQTAQPPVTVYTAPTQTSPVAVYTAPAAQGQAQTYSTGAAVIKPNMPDPSSAGVYRVQVGSYVDPQNAQAVAEALARVGLSPAYEQYGQNWRVVLPGISAQQLSGVAQYLGAVGIQEAWIRLEG